MGKLIDYLIKVHQDKQKARHIHDWTKWKKIGEITGSISGVLGFVQERTCTSCGYTETDRQSYR